jgi:hypothetical protein
MKMKVRILEISRDDAYYEDRDNLIGACADTYEIHEWSDGWQWYSVILEEPIQICSELVDHISFYEVHVEEVKE